MHQETRVPFAGTLTPGLLLFLGRGHDDGQEPFATHQEGDELVFSRPLTKHERIHVAGLLAAHAVEPLLPLTTKDKP